MKGAETRGERSQGGFAAALMGVGLAGLGLGVLWGVEIARRPPPPRPEPVVAAAVVDGAPIAKAELEAEARIQGAAPDGEVDFRSAAVARILDELIERRLLAREAAARGVADDAVVAARLERLRERVLADELIRRAVERGVTEAALRRRYDEQIRLVRLGDEVRARHILVETEAEAARLKARLDAGADFAELARRQSEDRSTAPNGGDLGWFIKGARIRPLSDAAFGTPPGEVAGPFPSDLGWHLLRVEERRRERPPSYEELEPELRRALTLETVRSVVSELRRKVAIDNRLAALARGEEPGVWPEPEDEDAPADGPEAVETAALTEDGDATEPDAGEGATDEAQDEPAAASTAGGVAPADDDASDVAASEGQKEDLAPVEPGDDAEGEVDAADPAPATDEPPTLEVGQAGDVENAETPTDSGADGPAATPDDAGDAGADESLSAAEDAESATVDVSASDLPEAVDAGAAEDTGEEAAPGDEGAAAAAIGLVAADLPTPRPRWARTSEPPPGAEPAERAESDDADAGR